MALAAVGDNGLNTSQGRGMLKVTKKLYLREKRRSSGGVNNQKREFEGLFRLN